MAESYLWEGVGVRTMEFESEEKIESPIFLVLQFAAYDTWQHKIPWKRFT